MDNLSIFFGALPRRFPHSFPLATLGWVPRKQARVRHGFMTCNISFIVRGTGTYRVDDGPVTPVQAPCAFIQVPGLAYDYGPTEWWSECFLIWDAVHEMELARCGLLRRERPYWPISGAVETAAVLDEILALGRCGAAVAQPDRMDRLAERLVLESLLGRNQAEAGPAGRIRALRRRIEHQLAFDVDWDHEAMVCGCSSTHFRRLWRQQVGMPPARWLAELRLRQACRQLVETDAPVGTIAQTVGFEDALYFARRFRSFTGCSATVYRRRYRLEPGLHLLTDAALDRH